MSAGVAAWPYLDAALGPDITPSDRPFAIVFVVLAVFFLALGVLSLVWALRDRRLFGYTAAAMLAGLTLMMVYETIALWTGDVPPISRLANEAFISHRRVWIVVYSIVIFFVGLLTVHFTAVLTRARRASRRSIRSEQLLVGSAGGFFALGAGLAWVFNWLP